MKFLLFLLIGVLCIGYLATQRQVGKNVHEAIQNHTVVMGMTSAQAKQALGEPLSVRQSQSLFGSAETLTFSDGNEVLFTADRATKIETVTLNKELTALKAAAAGQAANPNATPHPTGPLAWKTHLGGTALDRRPYQKYNGAVFYSGSDDPSKLGTASETDRRNGLYRER